MLLRRYFFFLKTAYVYVINNEFVRVAEHRSVNFTYLIVLEVMFLRLHNIIAAKLAKLNPSWADEQLYNEARRISIAIHQHFTYDEWLPIFLGEDAVREKQLICSDSSSPYCGKYDPTVDVSSFVEFSHSAFKFFHSISPEYASFFNESKIIFFFDNVAFLSLKIFVLFLDYTLIDYRPITEMVNGAAPLEKHFDNLVRGELIDGVQFDKYNDFVRILYFMHWTVL